MRNEGWGAIRIALVATGLSLAAVSMSGAAPRIAVMPDVDPVDATGFTANDTDFLNLMGNLEGPRGFGTVSDLAPALPWSELDSMTIGEVLDYQVRIRRMGTQSSAVGRYQFIHATLVQILRTHGISREMVFDGEIQTFLARLLMRDCGFYDVATPIDRLGNCLAGRWAALPLLSGPDAGLSAYHDDGLNHHLVSSNDFRNVLETRFRW
ncbi:hypothetical protein ACEUZ9_001112 [Paracoccus litorisediminis]|uniref:hypothetical protein n=1 Tax=Paracoccus litorisediminis TaxID=2006130 RepID=UPI003731CBC7